MTIADLPTCRVCHRMLQLDEEAYEVEICDIWIQDETVTMREHSVFECLECGDKKAAQ